MPREVDPQWRRRVTALQTALDLNNAGMATKFGVSRHTYDSWRYGEKNMGSSARMLLILFERKAKLPIPT